MERKKLFYIANIRFPTERAHGIQVAHMCSAFARNGVEVTLLVPNRVTMSEDPFSYYGVERNFRVEKIPIPDIVKFGRFGFLIESLLFAWRAVTQTEKEPGAIIYTREEFPLLFLSRRSAFYEAHQLSRSLFFRLLLKRAKRIISISLGLKDVLVVTGYPEGKILVAHDGYDEKQFSVSVTKEEVRNRLSLPTDRKIAMYIGGLETWKGSHTVCEAAGFLNNDNIVVVIIGGTHHEVGILKKNYPNIIFLGSKPYRDLPLNQQAADVLIVPNSAISEIGSRFTSPLKLFAHMASGVALVVADVPALKEVVGTTQVFTFTPDDPRSLADTVKRALSSEWSSEWLSKATEAGERVKDFTWDKRAKNVLAYITQVCTKESL